MNKIICSPLFTIIEKTYVVRLRVRSGIKEKKMMLIQDAITPTPIVIFGGLFTFSPLLIRHFL